MKSGTSDMNLAAPVWNCPTVAYGPGDSSLDHTPHEHILISEYQRAVKILADVLRDEKLV
jgi:LysW-gamma-L-lysine carboxypeptidase